MNADSRPGGGNSVFVSAALAAFLLLSPSLPCRAQSAAPKTNATVQSESVPVYSQMDTSSHVVQTLKKGAALFMDFQIAGSTGSWCGIRLPGQNARLGYVACGTLDIRVTRQPAQNAAAGPAPAGGGNSAAPPIPVTLDATGLGPANNYEQIKRLVVNEGEIDTVKLEALDAAARNRSAVAMTRAALAHIAAGRFDLSQNETDGAIDQFRSAMGLASHNRSVLFASLVDLANVYLVRSEYAPASRYLDQAEKMEPDSVVVAQLLGWADYRLNKTSDAVNEWRKAQRLHSNPAVERLLARAERDLETESKFHRDENRHFVLHYEGGAAPQLAEAILNTLQQDFESLQSLLQFTPAQPIGVVLYTGQTFSDVARAPKWSAAINDGRIRVPVQGLTSVTPELAHVLKHELTHSFVRQMTEGRCPTWLNEGLAQWVEGRRSNKDAKILVSMYDQKKYVSLSRLEGTWLNFPTPLAVYSYAWSLAAVESIIANSGMYGIRRLFTRLQEENSVQMALKTALQLSYPDLELQTVQYLKRTYPQ